MRPSASAVGTVSTPVTGRSRSRSRARALSTGVQSTPAGRAKQSFDSGGGASGSPRARSASRGPCPAPRIQPSSGAATAIISRSSAAGSWDRARARSRTWCASRTPGPASCTAFSITPGQISASTAGAPAHSSNGQTATPAIRRRRDSIARPVRAWPPTDCAPDSWKPLDAARAIRSQARHSPIGAKPIRPAFVAGMPGRRPSRSQAGCLPQNGPSPGNRELRFSATSNRLFRPRSSSVIRPPSQSHKASGSSAPVTRRANPAGYPNGKSKAASTRRPAAISPVRH